jgi:5-methylcytosine-specific restriction endonuclease McrA
MHITQTKEQLEQTIKESYSMRSVILKLGLQEVGNIRAKIKKFIDKYNLDTSHWKGQGWNKGLNKHNSDQILRRYNELDIFNEESKVSTCIVRKWLENEPLFVHKCQICNNEKWQGSPIPLDLDHIDGNNRNNLRTNLRFICPNCHAQTHTYRGKNINKTKKIVSEETIIEAIKNSISIRQVLYTIGLTPKGGNYNRIYNIMHKYNLQLKDKDILQIKTENDTKLIKTRNNGKELPDINIDILKSTLKYHGVVSTAKILNLSEYMIKRICKKLEIKLPTVAERNKMLMKFEVTKEELEKLVQEMPLTQIGKKFGVTDNAIRRRCKKMGIEIPKRKVWESSLNALKLGRMLKSLS